MPAVRVVNTRFHWCTSLLLRPMIVVFGLGTGLHVRMRAKSENGVIRNGQQSQSVVNRVYGMPSVTKIIGLLKTRIRLIQGRNKTGLFRAGIRLI